MTTNQIAYWNLEELKRTNLAKETETNRANLAKEAETRRSNLENEKETRRRDSLKAISDLWNARSNQAKAAFSLFKG